jgi:hypothetical protein
VGFGDEIAVLLMDNCSAHVTDDVIRLSLKRACTLYTFASQTTQIIRILHVILVAVLKRCPRYQLPFWDDNATAKLIMKAEMQEIPGYRGFHANATRISSFKPTSPGQDWYHLLKTAVHRVNPIVLRVMKGKKAMIRIKPFKK